MENIGFDNEKEKAFLDKVVETYKTEDSPQNLVMQELIIQTFEPFMKFKKDARGLQLGCCDKHQLEKLIIKLNKLDIIEGSKKFIEKAQTWTFANVNYIYALFEEYKPQNNIKYDFVFATYVLEHVMDVSMVLQMVKSVLKPDGFLFVVVPNARALSRQLALHMGLISDLKTLTQNDLDHGHRRIYDRVSLNKDLESSGFKIIAQGGIMLKFLADFQMERLIDEGILQQEQIQGLYKLGLQYPDLCGSLFAVCSSDN